MCVAQFDEKKKKNERHNYYPLTGWLMCRTNIRDWLYGSYSGTTVDKHILAAAG